MQSFIEYRAQRRLLESPMLDDDLDKSYMDKTMNYVNDDISKNHHTAKLIDSDNKYYHLPMKHGKNYYYRHDGTKNVETSVVENNIQTNVNKNGGLSCHLHNLMNHHINKTGRLMSDVINTNGSKHLWINFIKKNPDIEFHASHDWKDSKTKLTHENIDSLAPSIWGKNSENKNIRIIADK